MTGNLALEVMTRRMADLPALPKAVTEVSRALQRDDLSTHRCVELIETDPALAAATLKLANSPLYGMSGRIGSIHDAVRMLGLRAVSGLLTTVALRRAFRVDPKVNFKATAYWRHSFATGLLARALARRGELDPNEAFVTGLMHDVGQLVLAALYPVEAARAIALAQAQGISALAAEIQTMGMGHPQIGAMLVKHWYFPVHIELAIAQHHEPQPSAQGRWDHLGATIHAAEVLAHALDEGGTLQAAAAAMHPPIWRELGLADDEAHALLKDVERSLNEFSAAMSA
ncbi:MAG: hypothetical protein C4K60_06415 [Ideonella sp. MAG2]|nr:MAG: hypothetical protein C4K60_06415 [Ideonella sp. MAG2]